MNSTRPHALSYALVLDKAHRVLVEDGPEGGFGLPAVAQDGRRPLVAFEQRGFGSPHGSRRSGAAPHDRDFAFILSDAAVAAGAGRWLPLAEVATASDLVWELYCELLLGGYRPPSRTLDVFHFGNEPAQAAKLLHLVIKGQKRATASWVEALRRYGATVPSVGLVSVATDAFGTPGCILRTERVERLPLDAVPADFATAEGEGDLSLEDWMDGHLRYFEREATALGLRFGPDTEVLLERFRVLAVLGTADGGI